MPVPALKGWQVENLALTRKSGSITSPIIRLLPKNLLREQVEASECFGGGDVNSMRELVGGNSFDIERFAVGIDPGKRDSLHEGMVVIHIENDKAMTSIFEEVPDPGF